MRDPARLLLASGKIMPILREPTAREESKPDEQRKQTAELIEINRPRPAESVRPQPEPSQDNTPNSPAAPDRQEGEPAVAPPPTSKPSSLPSRDPITIPPQRVVESSPKSPQKLHVAEVIEISNSSSPEKSTSTV